MRAAILILLLVSLAVGLVRADVETPQQRLVESELTRMRYGTLNQVSLALADDAGTEPDEFGRFEDDVAMVGYKSPAKAFVLSLLVPGAGQFYYGSRVKPVVFLSIEALSWYMHFNFNADGDDLTEDYEAFNDAHWIESRYRDYLLRRYGDVDEEDVTEPEINHVLPDTKTQQYYEMTGKYDQFSWGWDDAELNGQGYLDYTPDPPPRMQAPNIPNSPRRTAYETMRDDANKKYDKATTMVFVAMANHLVSAFEAFFVTKHLNSQKRKEFGQESRLRMRAKMKSIYSSMDTPYFSVTYKF